MRCAGLPKFGGLTAPSADQLTAMHDREGEMAATVRDQQLRISALVEMMDCREAEMAETIQA